jgi:hypothetical protein
VERRLRDGTIEAFLIGPDYHLRRDALLAAAEVEVLAEAHRGTLTVASKPGETVFALQLPLELSSGSPPSPGPKTSAASGSPSRSRTARRSGRRPTSPGHLLM